MTFFCATLLWSFLLPASEARAQSCAGAPEDSTAYLLVRSDDMGMSHAANEANRRLIESGLPVSVSVMFATPWHQEAAAILRGHPEVSVGVHLTLGSEWKGYRWGPVAGQTAVPGLVDSAGYFLHSSGELLAQDPPVEAVEKELRAQVERALQTGLKIDYLDAHMGAATMKPEWRAVTEKLADEYSLVLSGALGETRANAFSRNPETLGDSLHAAMRRLRPGLNLMVAHVGLATPEMNALEDMNEGGVRAVGRHRQAQLQALTAPGFRRLLEARSVCLLTYRDLAQQRRAAPARDVVE